MLVIQPSALTPAFLSAALDEEPDVSQDEVVASIMGAKSPDSMSPAAQEYKDKIKEQIAKV